MQYYECSFWPCEPWVIFKKNGWHPLNDSTANLQRDLGPEAQPEDTEGDGDVERVRRGPQFFHAVQHVGHLGRDVLLVCGGDATLPIQNNATQQQNGPWWAKGAQGGAGAFQERGRNG